MPTPPSRVKPSCQGAGPLLSLGDLGNLHDASELAVLLEEAGGLSVSSNATAGGPAALRRAASGTGRCSTPRAQNDLAERVRQAVPLAIQPQDLAWSRLTAVVPSEALTLAGGPGTPSSGGGTPTHAAAAAHSMQQKRRKPAQLNIQVNSGGCVLFCLFSLSPQQQGSASEEKGFFSALGNALGLGHKQQQQAPGLAPLRAPATQEGVAVLKFNPSRLLCQAEQLASELARHCGVVAPASRVILQSGATAPEWVALEAAAARIGEPGGGDLLAQEMQRVPAALLMGCVPGCKFSAAPQHVFKGPELPLQLFHDLGRCFLLDCVLGNADRLCVPELGWRGNPNNLLLGASGSLYNGRLVAIDACVQRRPPAAKLDREDGAVGRMAQLALTDPGGGVVTQLLHDLLSEGPRGVTAALDQSPGSALGAFQAGMRASLERVVALKGLFEMMHSRISEFINDFVLDMKRAAPQLQLPLPSKAGAPPKPSSPQAHPPDAPPRPSKGSTPPPDAPSTKQPPRRLSLPEEAGSGSKVKPPASSTSLATPPPGPQRGPSAAPRSAPPPVRVSVSSSGSPSQPPVPTRMPQRSRSALDGLAGAGQELSMTMALRVVNVEARKDSAVSARVEQWRNTFRQHASALKSAADEWQARHKVERVLGMGGFFSGTHPIVDLYELKVRLDHMLRRMRVLEEAATACAPVRILGTSPGLWLGGATAADSHHVLRHLGITHIVNATEEVVGPPASEGFTFLRLPLRDTDDEDIIARLQEACDFIDSALGTPPPAATHTPAGAPRARAAAAGSAATRQSSLQARTPAAAVSTSAKSSKRGGVLVHCSEGRSRSVALVVGYLVTRRGMTLAQAAALVKSRRPEAAANAGFSQALIALEKKLRGTRSVEGSSAGSQAERASALELLGGKKAKPEGVRCPVCSEQVGVSSASLRMHVRSKHPSQAAALGFGAV